MTMAAKGVAKLIEECGELIQVLGKRLAWWGTDEPHGIDGGLRPWIREEMVARAMSGGHATVMFDDPSPDEDEGEVRIFYSNGVQIIYPARKGWW